MVVRGAWLLALLLVLPVAQAQTFSFPETFIPSQAQQAKAYQLPLPSGSTYTRVRVQLDVKMGDWVAGDEDDLYNILYLNQEGPRFPGGTIASVSVRGPPRNLLANEHGLGSTDGNTKRQGFSPVKGKTYHYDYVYDTAADSITLTVTESGQQVARITDVPFVNAIRASDGRIILSVSDAHAEPHASSIGWEYSNIQVEFTEGTASPEGEAPADATGTTGTQGTKAAGAYTPDETGEGTPVELLAQPGQFFEQPFQGRCSNGQSCPSTRSFQVPPGTYEKIIVTFDFRTHDLLPAGWYEHLVQLQDACSDQRLWRLMVKSPDETVLDARGNPDWLTGDTSYAEHTTYKAEIVYDLLDEETYVKVSDASGNVLSTIGDRLNSDPANVADIGATRDGLELVFGLERTYHKRIYGQPHYWTFGNLLVEAVPLGSGTGGAASGPEGADLGSDDGRLAFLAGQMIAAAEDAEYTLDCGPADEVLNSPSDSAAGSWCVLEHGARVAFGAFGDSEQAVLEALQDARFSVQVDPDDIDVTACDSIDTTLQEFQECDDAVPGFRTYAYADIPSGTSFIVVSKQVVDGFDTTIWEGIVGFFRRVFNIPEQSREPLPARRFHHGYFANVQGRQVLATWLDQDATLIYKGFVTDFNQSKPADAQYGLGRSSQRLTLELDEDSPADVRMWRRMTAAIRIADVDGSALQGDTCGNGVIGADEQCEPSIPLDSCEELFPQAQPGAATCTSTCTVDVSSCLGDKTASGCFDTWTEPPSYNPCPADPACPSGGGSSDGGGLGEDGGSSPQPPSDPPACTPPSAADYVNHVVAPWSGHGSNACPTGYTALGLNTNTDIRYCAKTATLSHVQGSSTQSVANLSVSFSGNCAGKTLVFRSGNFALCKATGTLSYAPGSSQATVLADVMTMGGDVACQQGWEKFSYASGLTLCAQYVTVSYDPGECLAGPQGSSSEITLFEHAGYEGRNLLVATAVPSLDALNFNDITSSYRVSSGQWQLCQHVNYGGWCTMAAPEDQDWSRKDALSSLRPFTNGIVLYSDANHEGFSQLIVESTGELSGYFNPLAGQLIPRNDETSSVQVIAGTWELCEHKDYGGACMIVSQNVLNLGNLNDKITSVRLVTSAPQCASEGQNCASSSCCAGLSCTAGVCTSSFCSQQGQSCAIDTDCCEFPNNRCDPDSGICAPFLS